MGRLRRRSASAPAGPDLRPVTGRHPKCEVLPTTKFPRFSATTSGVATNAWPPSTAWGYTHRGARPPVRSAHAGGPRHVGLGCGDPRGRHARRHVLGRRRPHAGTRRSQAHGSDDRHPLRRGRMGDLPRRRPELVVDQGRCQRHERVDTARRRQLQGRPRRRRHGHVFDRRDRRGVGHHVDRFRPGRPEHRRQGPADHREPPARQPFRRPQRQRHRAHERVRDLGGRAHQRRRPDRRGRRRPPAGGLGDVQRRRG